MMKINLEKKIRVFQNEFGKRENIRVLQMVWFSVMNLLSCFQSIYMAKWSGCRRENLMQFSGCYA